MRSDRVLIVDSDERASTVIKNFLVNDGFDVTTVFSGEMVLNALRSWEYDLLLIDSGFADLVSSCFFRQLLKIPQKPLVIVMDGFLSRPGGLAPYNPIAAGRFVNKWRPCEILKAVHQARVAPPVSERVR